MRNVFVTLLMLNSVTIILGSVFHAYIIMSLVFLFKFSITQVNLVNSAFVNQIKNIKSTLKMHSHM